MLRSPWRPWSLPWRSTSWCPRDSSPPGHRLDVGHDRGGAGRFLRLDVDKFGREPGSSCDDPAVAALGASVRGRRPATTAACSSAQAVGGSARSNPIGHRPAAPASCRLVEGVNLFMQAVQESGWAAASAKRSTSTRCNPAT